MLHSQRDDKIEEARKLFELSIKTDPSIPNGHNQLGLLYLWDLRKFDKAADEFRKAIEMASQWSNYQVNLAEAPRHAGKHEDAIAAAYKAIQIYPHNKRAACLLREKNHKDLTKCRPAESRTK